MNQDRDLHKSVSELQLLELESVSKANTSLSHIVTYIENLKKKKS